MAHHLLVVCRRTMSKRASNVGIWGIGVHLPEHVRTNDWWPREIVEGWQERSSAKLDRAADNADEAATEGARVVLECMAEVRNDPFKGARERRVIPDDMRTSEMEIAAAKEAIARAGVDPQEIDLLLSTTSLPDYLMVPNSCRTHERLGLARRCFALQTEGVCNAFAMQLTLADSMIRAGRARRALLIQSSAVSRFMRREDPMSAWFGDGATAVVVGPVAEGYGILGHAHEADGSLFEGLVCGVPNKQWYEGTPYAYIVRPELSRRLFLEAIHLSRGLIHAALDDAGFSPADVSFYAAHQGFAWLRKATQQLAGLQHARYVDTFAWAGSMLGSNIPLVLSMGERDGLLRSGDVVATFSGASGAILASLAMRWGRG
jgi:3-oxoacyl-[acyl-carrier-protein] synthase-3